MMYLAAALTLVLTYGLMRVAERATSKLIDLLKDREKR